MSRHLAQEVAAGTVSQELRGRRAVWRPDVRGRSLGLERGSNGLAAIPRSKVDFRLLLNDDACATEKTAEAGFQRVWRRARFAPILLKGLRAFISDTNKLEDKSARLPVRNFLPSGACAAQPS